jgi:hypothetical protein
MSTVLGILLAIMGIVGAALASAGWVGLWIEAFRQSVLWGLLAVFIPPVTIAFAFFHWRTARIPALCLLIGIGLMSFDSLLFLAVGVAIQNI